MTYYLPPSSDTDGRDQADAAVQEAVRQEHMADLKVFWGPEICRLEYLVHLMDTGRIKDEREQHSVEVSVSP
jgi:hypothetical protein